MTLLEEETRPEISGPDLFIIALGERAGEKALRWVYELRRQGCWVEMDYEGKGLKAQMKRADRVGARRVLIVGDDEIASGKAALRDMIDKTQTDISLRDLVQDLKKSLG